MVEVEAEMLELPVRLEEVLEMQRVWQPCPLAGPFCVEAW